MAALESPYLGRRATLPTLHGKESAISPIFQSVLGISVEVSKVDTDQFGTFSGETPRTLSQFDAAVAKARAAIALTGIPLAIASEGTIGPHPMIPIASSDVETLVFIDSERDLIIHETFQSSEIVTARAVVRPGENLDAILSRADFPTHAMIVRTEGPAAISAIKGIRDIETLEKAIQKLAQDTGSVIVECDLRASSSPSRMLNIAECASLLAGRILSSCPQCHSPGWGRVAPVFGLPCGDCGELVESAVAADQLGCVKCDHKRTVPRLDNLAEARFCDSCNP